MNQSVENGNMPLGGDTPFSSLYSLMSRSRDRLVSDLQQLQARAKLNQFDGQGDFPDFEYNAF